MPADKKTLFIFLSHPIQHFIPWFQAMNARLDGGLKVYYASRHGLDIAHDPEFNESFSWDMDLLAGYPHEFLNESGHTGGPNKGFMGIHFPGIYSLLKQERPTAVMIFGWLFAGYWEVAHAASQLQIPYILRGESNLLNRGNELKWWIKDKTIGHLCRGAAACLAIGQRNAELYKAYGVSENRIKQAPYFVDNDLFSRESNKLNPSKNQLRKKLGLPEDSIVFLFMGKLINKKHPDHLLQAWSGLPENLRNKSAILMVGNGSMMDELRLLAGGKNHIAFSGFLNRKELMEAYTASDVLVLPSDEGETWGLVVNEAMASGLPVIVSDRVGCAPDLVINGKTGYTFRFGEIKELQNIMSAILQNPNSIKVMGDYAAEYIKFANADNAGLEVKKILESLTAK